MSTSAFIDESIRRDRYLVCASVIDARDLIAARQALRSLLSSGQQRIHFNSESDGRRRRILNEIAALEVASLICSARGRDQVGARAAALHEVVVHLRRCGVDRLVLETRQGQDHRDQAVIRRVAAPDPAITFSYTHETPRSEPLLWVPDAVAWAWAAGVLGVGRSGICDWSREPGRSKLAPDAATSEGPAAHRPVRSRAHFLGLVPLAISSMHCHAGCRKLWQRPMKGELSMVSLKGAVAVVTGASSGIGLAIAARFVAAGAQVLAGSRSEPPDSQRLPRSGPRSSGSRPGSSTSSFPPSQRPPSRSG